MNLIPMVAVKSGFHYDGRDLKAGDEFFATPGHAKLLAVVGNAKQQPAQPAGLEPTGVIVDDLTPAPKKRRSYNRRDMRAA